MIIYVDGETIPTPDWADAEDAPATVGEFVARLAGDLAAKGRWPMDAPSDFDAPVKDVAVIVLKTTPIADLRKPVAAGLASVADDHYQAAAALRNGFYDVAAERLQSLSATWGAVADALDAMDAMKTLPPAVRVAEFEKLMFELDQFLPGDLERAAAAVERLGELAAAWMKEIEARAPPRITGN